MWIFLSLKWKQSNAGQTWCHKENSFNFSCLFVCFLERKWNVYFWFIWIFFRQDICLISTNSPSVTWHRLRWQELEYVLWTLNSNILPVQPRAVLALWRKDKITHSWSCKPSAMEKNLPKSEDVQECLKHTGRHKPNKTIVYKNRMLEAVGGEQGDLPCYHIQKCAVCSSSPIYNPLGEDERATERLAGLRPAGEAARVSLSENHPQDLGKADKSLVLIGKSLFLARFTSAYPFLFTPL